MNENLKEFKSIVDGIAESIESNDEEAFKSAISRAQALTERVVDEDDTTTAMKLIELFNKLNDLIEEAKSETY